MGKDEKQEQRKQQRKEALKCFFDDANYDIDDENKFNEKILRRRYRRLALIHHPDTQDGNEKEWLELCMYYGILTRICEFQIKEREQNSKGYDKEKDATEAFMKQLD